MYEYYVLPFFLDLGTDSCFSFMFYRFKSFGFSYFYFLCLAWVVQFRIYWNVYTYNLLCWCCDTCVFECWGKVVSKKIFIAAL